MGSAASVVTAVANESTRDIQGLNLATGLERAGDRVSAPVTALPLDRVLVDETWRPFLTSHGHRHRHATARPHDIVPAHLAALAAVRERSLARAGLVIAESDPAALNRRMMGDRD